MGPHKNRRTSYVDGKKTLGDTIMREYFFSFSNGDFILQKVTAPHRGEDVRNKTPNPLAKLKPQIL